MSFEKTFSAKKKAELSGSKYALDRCEARKVVQGARPVMIEMAPTNEHLLRRQHEFERYEFDRKSMREDMLLLLLFLSVPLAGLLSTYIPEGMI